MNGKSEQEKEEGKTSERKREREKRTKNVKIRRMFMSDGELDLYIIPSADVNIGACSDGDGGIVVLILNGRRGDKGYCSVR